MPMKVGGRSLAQIDGDLEDRPYHAAHQLGLAVRVGLVSMHAAQRVAMRGVEGHVDLSDDRFHAALAELPRVERARKPATFVLDRLGRSSSQGSGQSGVCT